MTIETVSALFDALGGNTVVRQRLGLKRQAVHVARKKNRLPAPWQIPLDRWAKDARLDVSDSLFGINGAKHEDV